MTHTLWRKFDSSSGRWTSPDPYGGSMSVASPQTFNRYSYVNNDPVNQVDPSGLIPYSGADVGWSDVQDGFWGSSFDFNQTHFGGPEIIQNGMNDFPDRQEEPEESPESIDAGTPLVDDPSVLTGTVVDPQQSSNIMTRTDGNPEHIAIDEDLAKLFTNGGIVRGASAYRNLVHGDTHFRLKDGTVHTIHIFGDEAGRTLGGVYIPKQFSVIKYESDGTISATNPKTGQIIGAAHIDATSQTELNRNLRRPTNAAGSRYIGRVGGPGGEGANDTHAHLTIYPNAESRRIARAYKGPQKKQLRDFDSKISVHLGDFRRLVR